MTDTTFAAAVYARDLAQRDALARFASDLREQGVRVGGLVQDFSRS